MTFLQRLKARKIARDVLHNKEKSKAAVVKKFTGETVCQPVEEEIRQRLQAVIDDYCDGSVSVCQMIGILFDMQVNLKMNH